MANRRNKAGALSPDEKRIVKGLLDKGWRNQDIQALVNIERKATINSARISEVKNDPNQAAASDEEIEFFDIKKRSYDPRTGLNFFENERLIRAREAMILAVQVFNNAGLGFKTEVFSVLANIAWTYLLHEYYLRRGVKVFFSDGRSLLLGQMIGRADCDLSDGIKKNLDSMKRIRDCVEHKLLGKADIKWRGLFQACCLNFDRTMCRWFGERLTLANELAFALQFTKMDIEQLASLNRFEIPESINAFDASLEKELTNEQLRDLEYQFRVIYTLSAASKSRAHFEFVRPDSSEGKEISNVLVQYRAADHLYPHKPSKVCELVSQKVGRKYTLYEHTLAWRRYSVRPPADSRQPENTNKDYCIYHEAHGDYTYSNKWIDKLATDVIMISDLMS